MWDAALAGASWAGAVAAGTAIEVPIVVPSTSRPVAARYFFFN
jgi:hypothetical protein